MSENILVPVSIGEIIDKLSILYIKKECIMKNVNDQKIRDIDHEINQLEPIATKYITKYDNYWKCLMWVNKRIWDMNELRTTEKDRNIVKEMIVDIMIENDARFRIKSRLNYATNSNIKEHKSYNTKKTLIKVDKIDKHITGLITYLSIHCDTLYIKCNDNLIDRLESVKVDSNTIVIKESDIDPLVDKTYCDCSSISINMDELGFNYNKPIKYAIGGKLGDFIHHLYLVYHNYIVTGKKGIVYMKNTGFDKIDRTYNELYEIVSSQKYIEKFEQHNGQYVDIDCIYSNSPYLYKINWIDFMIKSYTKSTECSLGKWIELESSEEIKNKFCDKIVIHTRQRTITNFDWLNVVSSNKCTFITCDRNDYESFPYKDRVELYLCKDLQEIFEVIQSSKFFIGSQSSPLAIRCALHKSCLAELYPTDDIHYMGLEKYIPGFTYSRSY